MSFCAFYEHYELCIWETKQEANRHRITGAFVVHTLIKMFAGSDVPFETIAKEIGMFVKDKNVITSEKVASDIEKANNVMAAFLGTSNWSSGTQNGG